MASGIDWTPKEFELILKTHFKREYNATLTEYDYTYTITGQCAFIGLVRSFGAAMIRFYGINTEKNSITVNVNASKTINGEITETESTNTYRLSNVLNYNTMNENVNEDAYVENGMSTSYKKWSDIYTDLEEKWYSEFEERQCLYYALSLANSMLDHDAVYQNEKVSVLDSYAEILSSSGDVPIYLEDKGGEKYYGAFANEFPIVSSMVKCTYDNNVYNLPLTQRFNIIPNLLCDYEKYKDGTSEKDYERRLDIYVNLDGTKKPTANISWIAKGRYGDDVDFSKYKFDIYTLGSGGENKTILGSFPLDSTETVTFGNKEMSMGDYSGNYIQIAFNTDWLSSDWWIATIYDNITDFSEDYNKLSVPNEIPELHINYNTKQSGDNEDSGNGGKDENSGGDNGSGVNPHSLLTTTYILTPNRIQQLGSVLWNSSFLDNILLVNNVPIENILSVKMFPFTFPSGSDSEVKLGNVAMGVNGQKLPNNYNYRHDIGSVSVTKHYNSFLDFAPYTKLMLYLPYYGVTELDCSVYMGRRLSVSYIIDVVVGSCLINVYADGVLTNQFSSQVGIDIPITASNRAKVESAIVANSLKSIVTADVGGLVNSLITGGFSKYHTQVSGSPSSACGMYAYKNPMIIIDRPSYTEIVGYSHSVGRTCLQHKQIRNVRGYTEMSDSIDLTGIPAMSTELEEIKNILTNGFYA